ncbi:hypothetical protein CANARDRAFT_197503 [[Candida] arabinofermentans NRRL YB-2248]|uniref:Cytidine deaminase n=1 Tax=[Candida] arabinofermentans NRRL YB-2248 TaxID=983967 RepID=A0A1E4T276_9ASCO|nr:hypothetical protein CANARDRAFT_197503 [[Candida] arabinofermentans NRRL YB-2248]
MTINLADDPRISDEQYLTLKSKALESRNLSYSPYSKFRVGCTILTETDEYIVGANIENASYGAAICAERTAIVKAATSGFMKFKALAVSTDLETCASPCGICRQVIREFSNDKQLPVYMFNKDGSKVIKMTIDELLPLSFGPEDLGMVTN